MADYLWVFYPPLVIDLVLDGAVPLYTFVQRALRVVWRVLADGQVLAAGKFGSLSLGLRPCAGGVSELLLPGLFCLLGRAGLLLSVFARLFTFAQLFTLLLRFRFRLLSCLLLHPLVRQ